MYVVGQFPSFLRHNWNFLKTVIKKLIEFMKEEFPGIMEMACNAFLKIAKNTSEQFTIIQNGESEPYICDIIRRLPDILKRFNNDSLHYLVYESIGYIIASEP